MSRHTTTITVQDVPVTVMQVDQNDYISLTDMAKARTDSARAADVIKNWLRTRSTLEFLGTWEIMYNPDFKVVEFDHFKSEAGLRHYIDRACSAKTDNRPEFQHMIRDSKEKLFDIVLVWKLDRFARNRYDSAQYKTQIASASWTPA